MTAFATWVVMLAGLAGIVILGVWLWMRAIDGVCKLFTIPKEFCEWLWHRKKFKRWLEANCDKS